MKKLFLLAVTALAMTACSSEEDVYVKSGQQEIAFSPVSYTLARNTPADGTDFTASNMNVTAIYTENEGTSYDKYFEDVVCAKDGSVWKSGKYWPLSGKMMFFGYSSSTTPDDADWKYDTSTNAFAGLDLDFTATKLNGFDDLLYSNYTALVTCAKVGGVNNPVAMVYNHGLAWLTFECTGSTDVKVYDVTVNGVSLSGKAEITYDNGRNVIAWPKASLTGAENVSIKNGATTVYPLSSTASKLFNGVLVPTQTQEGKSITIKYTITNGSKESDPMYYTYIITKDVTTDTWNDWNAGSKYIYKVNITLNEITFSATVVDFDPDIDAADETV